jgi:hypothetical protein
LAAAWGCSGESKRVGVQGVLAADLESSFLGFKILGPCVTFGSENFQFQRQVLAYTRGRCFYI